MDTLARAAAEEGRVYLTGGATAVLMGWRESTIDVDFKLVPESDSGSRNSRRAGEPPHIHVAQAERYVKYWLNPVLEEYSEGFSPSQHSMIRSIIEDHRVELLEAWHAHFA